MVLSVETPNTVTPETIKLLKSLVARLRSCQRLISLHETKFRELGDVNKKIKYIIGIPKIVNRQSRT